MNDSDKTYGRMALPLWTSKVLFSKWFIIQLWTDDDTDDDKDDDTDDDKDDDTDDDNDKE